MSATSVVPATAGEPGADAPARKEQARWEPVMTLPCRFTVALLLPNFKVDDFLRLRPGSVINTGWGIGRDVPLRVNGILIGWGELEGAGSRMAVRVTELA